MAAHAVLDDFWDGAMPPRNHGLSGRHGFYHDKAERLRPVDGKQQGQGVAYKRALLVLIDFTDKLDEGIVKQGANDLFEIGRIGGVDLGSDPQWDAGAF